MIAAHKKMPEPTPCVVVKYENGQPVSQETVVRPVLSDPNMRKESDTFVRRWRVMATQETGEEQFVGYADSLPMVDDMIARHEAAHPEHRGCWYERV